MCCLRAAVESRLRHGEARTSDEDFLAVLLEQLNRLCGTAELIRMAVEPASVRPLSCSLSEILASVACFLPREERERLTLAPGPSGRAWIDGPLLSMALAQILQASMGADSAASIELHLSSDTLHASLHIDEPTGEQHALLLSCAWRELERLRASTRLARSCGSLTVTIEIPAAGCFEQEAAA